MDYVNVELLSYYVCWIVMLAVTRNITVLKEGVLSRIDHKFNEL